MITPRINAVLAVFGLSIAGFVVYLSLKSTKRYPPIPVNTAFYYIDKIFIEAETISCYSDWINFITRIARCGAVWVRKFIFWNCIKVEYEGVR